MNQLNRQTLNLLTKLLSEGRLDHLYERISEIQISGTESPEDLLDYLGFQVDVASLRQDTNLAKDAIARLQKFIEVTEKSGLKGIAYYFLANAYDVSWQIKRRSPEYVPSWTDLELHKQKVALSEALRFREAMPKARLLQIFTNLANTLDRMGRCTEACYFYDKALEMDSGFEMALGNKGLSLEYCARFVTDPHHRTILVKEAHRMLTMALSRRLDPEARTGFVGAKENIEKRAPPGLLDGEPINVNAEHEYENKEHQQYVKFCCAHRLFLNPLAQLGPFPIASGDPLHLPPFVTPVADFSGYYFFSYFNSLKQEYATARLLLFESQRPVKKVHYADREVFLVNTLDYPCYSTQTEFLKLAFRSSYSLLDKIAFFLNAYLSLGIPDDKIYLRTIWYEDYRVRRLRPQFRNMSNPGAMALFYLSQDLFESQTTNNNVETYLRYIAAYRHALEHRFLKLHDMLYTPPKDSDNPFDQFQAKLKDPKTPSVYQTQFFEDAVQLFRIVKAALMYLTMTMVVSEDQKREETDQDKILPGMMLDTYVGTYEDDWKRH